MQLCSVHVRSWSSWSFGGCCKGLLPGDAQREAGPSMNVQSDHSGLQSQLQEPASTACDLVYWAKSNKMQNKQINECRYLATCTESCLCSLPFPSSSTASRAVARAAGQPHTAAEAPPAGRAAAPAAATAAAAAAPAAAAGLLQCKGPCSS